MLGLIRQDPNTALLANFQNKIMQIRTFEQVINLSKTIMNLNMDA